MTMFGKKDKKAKERASIEDVENFEDALDEATDEIQQNKSQEEERKKQKKTQGVTPIVGGPQSNTVGLRKLSDGNIQDRAAFMEEPAPIGRLVQCRVFREADGPLSSPKYLLSLEHSSQFMLAARKRVKNKTSNYLISLDSEDLGRSSGNYFGKLRSNFVGTEFCIFDRGEKPAKTTGPGVRTRKHLGCIIYEANFLGTKGPRRIQILLPTVGADGRRMAWPLSSDTTESDSYAEQIKHRPDVPGLMKLKNKEPVWSEELKAYVLNFGGRVSQPSVKNFQVVAEKNPNMIFMQFGKVGKNEFTLDYQFPMSGLQAFAIALSAFDNKLLCE